MRHAAQSGEQGEKTLYGTKSETAVVAAMQSLYTREATTDALPSRGRCPLSLWSNVVSLFSRIGVADFPRPLLRHRALDSRTSRGAGGTWIALARSPSWRGTKARRARKISSSIVCLVWQPRRGRSRRNMYMCVHSFIETYSIVLTPANQLQLEQPRPPPQLPQHPQPHTSAPILHAPQPHHAYPPPLDWSQAPPLIPPPNRIIATPSWTASFTDPMPSALPQSSSQSLFNPTSFSPPPAPDSTISNSSTTAPSSYPFSNAALFTLPPTTTFFNDVNSAMASSAAPSAFYSSYGLYQPISGPYARFLTPSPEPSVLGDFELDLDMGGAGESLWRELDTAADDRGSGEGSGGGEGSSMGRGTSDPFAGMTMAQVAASRANSPGGGGQNGAYEQSTMTDHPSRPPTLPQSFATPDGSGFDLYDHQQYAAYASEGFGGNGNGNLSLAGGESEWAARNGESGGEGVAGPSSASTDAKGAKKQRKSRAKPRTGEKGSDAHGATAGGKTGGKKNRNPHATQLPGNGTRKLPKPEASEGHEGPMCTHCGSIATPLWRRGPDDELLCNALVSFRSLSLSLVPRRVRSLTTLRRW
jgi:hypothetical protein